MEPVLALQISSLSDVLNGHLDQRLVRYELHGASLEGAAAWLTCSGQHVDVVVTNGRVGCPAALIDRLPRLRLIAVHGVGYDCVAIEEAKRRGIAVTHTPGALTEDVADLAVGLVIALLRGIPHGDLHVRQGSWLAGPLPLGTRVSGKRFGIVGLGRIGQAISHRLAPFGQIAYTGPKAKPVPWRYCRDAILLARTSDVLIVACAANRSTTGLIDERVLSALPPSGFLVNVARGAIVKEADLAKALSAGRIAGAALDVFSEEPDVGARILESRSTVLTPHIGSATFEARQAMAAMLLESVDAYLEGKAIPHRVV